MQQIEPVDQLAIVLLGQYLSDAGILEGTGVEARRIKSRQGSRRIALVWRRSSPREAEFQLLAQTLRQIASDVIPSLAA